MSLPENGEMVCGNCGLVLNEKMVDYSHSGKRAFTTQEKNNGKELARQSLFYYRVWD